MLNNIRDWASALIPFINLLAILVAAIKIINRVDRDLADWQRRLTAAEAAIRSLEQYARVIDTVSVRLNDLSSEIIRMRDRLDKFLDAATKGKP